MTDWTNEQNLLFLELYQGEPIIWDPHHKYHKDKKKVSDARGRLSTMLETSVKELKTRKDTLMGTFRRHLKKKQESKKSGAGVDDVYEPIWFAYPLMESFLLPIYTTRPTINTEETSQSTSQNEREVVELEPVPSPELPQIEESTETTRAKKSRRHPAPDSAERQMTSAFNQLTGVLSQRRSQPTAAPIDDDCDLYGKLLATKLRDYSKDERKLIMYDIDGIFIRRIQNRSPGRYTPSPQSPISRPPSALTPYSRLQSASTPYSRPQSASTSYSLSSPSGHSSNSYKILSPSAQPSNTYLVPRPSAKTPCANSFQPLPVQIQTPSIQSQYTNLHQPQPSTIQSPCSNSFQYSLIEIQHPSIQCPDSNSPQPQSLSQTTNSLQPSHEQSSPSSETRINSRSNIINMALLNTFEQFDSEETSEQ